MCQKATSRLSSVISVLIFQFQLKFFFFQLSVIFSVSITVIYFFSYSYFTISFEEALFGKQLGLPGTFN